MLTKEDILETKLFVFDNYQQIKHKYLCKTCKVTYIWLNSHRAAKSNGNCQRCAAFLRKKKKGLFLNNQKLCRICKRYLDFNKFSIKHTQNGQLNSGCTKCNNLIKYKITSIEYEQLVIAQNNKCSICDKPEISIDKTNGKLRDLSVDHNHETGKIRGLLCTGCNIGIGLFKENSQILKKAIEYLKIHN